MGAVRITSGVYRGRKIETPAGEGTRPLLTRLRKTLADLLRPRLAGARVLDLFGGSGAIAFELLSNGAESAVIVEKDPAAAALVRKNAVTLQARAQVMDVDALTALGRFRTGGGAFDLVVVAPPYGLGLQAAALRELEQGTVVAPGGTVVVQRDFREPAGEPRPGLALERVRRYGRTVFEFYARKLP